MESQVIFAIAVTSLAFYATVFHGWIFWLRHEERTHLWFAVTCLGIFGTNSGLLLHALAPELSAKPWVQSGQGFASLLLTYGFLRFAYEFLHIERTRFHKVFDYYILLAASACSIHAVGLPTPFKKILIPHAFRGEIGPLEALSLVPIFLAAFYAVYLFLSKAGQTGVRAKPIVFALGLWTLTGASDTAVSAGLYDFPFMMHEGYVITIAVISTVVLRPIVEHVGQLENRTGNLQELVEERTKLLRQRDLQIVQSEKLAAIGTLAAGVAHEINNPMAYLSSNINYLEEIWEKPDEQEEPLEVLSECREGIEHVRAIVQDLMAFSRPAEGDTQAFDLHAIIDNVLPMVRHEARDKARLEMDLEAVPSIEGDPRLVRQLLLNLLLNAIQAIPEGTPAEHSVKVLTRLDDGAVLLHVRDTGEGIPEAQLSKIFEPFYTTKDPDRGTGLGLSVSYQIVSLLGGRLSVESRPGATTFTASFPPSDAPAEDPLESPIRDISHF